VRRVTSVKVELSPCHIKPARITVNKLLREIRPSIGLGGMDGINAKFSVYNNLTPGSVAGKRGNSDSNT